MPRYIDADLLKSEIEDTDEFDGIGVKFYIDSQPTADVKEVVYGEWEVIGKGRFRCSKCGAEEYRCIVERNECMACSCWNCGADMRKGE